MRQRPGRRRARAECGGERVQRNDDSRVSGGLYEGAAPSHDVRVLTDELRCERHGPRSSRGAFAASAARALKVALVTVVVGDRYARYARLMLASAERWFLRDTGADISRLMFQGREGWPAATMYRYHVLLENADVFRDAEYVFHIDADMRFVAPVGNEVLAPLVATRHPGYLGRRGPYEDRPASVAYIPPTEGNAYYCGAFNGGERGEFLRLADAIRAAVDADAELGITAVWHDESQLNRYLVDRPPDVALSPSYAYPEDDKYYIRKIWPEQYEPKILACRKPRAVQWSHRLERIQTAFTAVRSFFQRSS
jgi:hypothetical protein